MRFWFLLTCALVPGLQARAEERPALAPTRDVTVTYQLTGISKQPGATSMRVAYANNDQRIRLDFFAFATATSPFSSVIFDAPANQVITLVYEQQKYYILPATGRANPGLLLSDKMSYVRQGDETVAGLPCTDWRISNGPTIAGSACVTADGVVLRAVRTQPNPGTMDASAVTYGTPPEGTFKPPPDLQLGANK
jgi:hypothetical protein